MSEPAGRARALAREYAGRLLDRWDRRSHLTPDERRALLEDLFYERAELVPYLFRFGILMGLGAVIAALGLLADSPAIVIGAMVVAPLMTPIMAFSASLVMAWPRRQLKAAALVAAASGEAIGLAWAVAAVIPAARTISLSHELLARTEPRLLDLAVGLAAGAAGAYVTVRRKAVGALPGVAIAVALVPPLAAVGVLLELGDPRKAGGAMLLFSTNLAAIVLASAIVFLLTGVVPRRHAERKAGPILLGTLTAMLAVGAVAYPLGRESLRILGTSQDERAVSVEVNGWIEGQALDVAGLAVGKKGGETTITVDLVGATPPRSTETLADLIAARLHRRVTVDVRWIARYEEKTTVARP